MLKKFYFCSLLTFQGKKLSGLMWDNFKKNGYIAKNCYQ